MKESSIEGKYMYKRLPPFSHLSSLIVIVRTYFFVYSKMKLLKSSKIEIVKITLNQCPSQE